VSGRAKKFSYATKHPPSSQGEQMIEMILTETSGAGQEAAAPSAPKRKHRRLFAPGTPKEALTWKSPKSRAARLYDWQCAVLASFRGNAHTLGIAWLLSTLCEKEGYAYATDSYLSRVTGVQINHVQAVLSKLEKAGAIVRGSVFQNGKAQRRIWPGTKIIPAKSGGTDTPRIWTRDTSRIRGTDSLRTHRDAKSVRKTEADHARAAAELTERNARERRRLRIVAGTEIPEAESLPVDWPRSGGG
jgi:hypothetical protein